MPVSDAVIPQPAVQTGNCYMGDYDYWQADGTSVQGSWTDSRGVGSGGSQDVFHDDISVISGTPTPTGTVPTNTPAATDTPGPTNSHPHMLCRWHMGEQDPTYPSRWYARWEYTSQTATSTPWVDANQMPQALTS